MERNNMKVLKVVLLVLGILGVIFLAGYLGIWVMLIGGIVQVIDSAKAMPTDALGVAIGVVRVLGAGVVGAITFWVGAAVIGLIAVLSD
jgi:hypothetical protein